VYTKKISQKPLHHHQQPCRTIGTLLQFMLFMPNSAPTIWMTLQKSRLIRLYYSSDWSNDAENVTLPLQDLKIKMFQL